MASYRILEGFSQQKLDMELGTAARILFPKFTGAPVYR